MEAYPMRSGTRNKLKLTRSEQSVQILCDLVSTKLRVEIADVHSCIILLSQINLHLCALDFSYQTFIEKYHKNCATYM